MVAPIVRARVAPRNAPPAPCRILHAVAASTRLVNGLRDGYRILAELRSRGGYSEADTRQHLIDPLIESLYDAARIRRELGDAGNRPDYVLYSRPLVEDGPARVIVEAKPLDADFERYQRSGDRTETPHRQARRYLRDHAAGTQSTLGALTDGLRWRLYRKAARGEVEQTGEIDLGPLVRGENEAFEPLDALLAVLAPATGRQRQGAVGERALRALAAAVGNEADALRALGAVSAPYPPVDVAELQSRARDQALDDWEAHAHGDGPVVETEKVHQPSLLDAPRVRIAAVRFAYNERGIGREDAARCARTFAAQSASRTAVVFVWQLELDGRSLARIATAHDRRVSMTQPFDPELPPPTAHDAAARVLELLRRETVKPQSFADALDVLPLQRSFYEEVRRWMRGLRSDDGAFRETPDTNERHEILLRHLIRTLFVWILKEEGDIPGDLFDRQFVTESGIGGYHDEVLRYLFHERLNKEERDRDPHPVEAFADVPFLNGSLFERRAGDDRLSIADTRYWSDGERDPGLFDVLARYHWTADEQRPGEREQTLDPELLSNLFEQLVADPLLEDRDEDETLKAPDGAYYTPMDVTAEMAADALAAAVRARTPASVRDDELLDLFRDPDAALPPALSGPEREPTRQRMLGSIGELRIFDPATGSGAFLLAVFQALRTALGKLNGDERHDSRSIVTRAIITYQLMGQDINPMAAQIARLRLFIALWHAERERAEPPALPNLEARIVCADTLAAHPGDDYDPFARGANGTLGANGWTRDALENAIRRLAAVRARWPGASSESAKRARRNEDRDRRDELRGRLADDAWLHPDAVAELRALADYPLLEMDHDAPARIDPRLLFAQDERDWPGFDIVIGNPPYQSFRNSGIGDDARDALVERGYRTTGAADLYTLFCEAALGLAKPDGGAVALVVPLSIAFGRQERDLRAIFTERCRSVSVRSYDNIPDTIFNQHPLFKVWKNRQRATIVTAVRKREPTFTLQTDAMMRWRDRDRTEVLRRRPRIRLRGTEEWLGEQWPRVPNDKVAEMIQAVTAQRTTIGQLRADAPADGETHALSFPPTAGYFVSALPPGTRDPSREVLLPLPDEETRLLAMTALNGHVAYGWWRAFGDGFDVKLSDYAAFTIPDSWVEEGEERDWALYLGQELIDAIDASRKAKLNAGQRWPNVDFFEHQPELIEALDAFHIKSLSLDAGELLPTLQLMRSPDGWDFE